MSSDMNVIVAARHGEEQLENILGHEYEHEPVPASARRSAFSVTMVWIGFPMIITGAMTGSILVLGMGFKSALMAMIIGDIIMFIEFWFPGLSTAISAAVVGGIVYYGLAIAGGTDEKTPRIA